MSIEPTAVYPPGPYPGNPQQSGQQGRIWVVQQPEPKPSLLNRVNNRIPNQQQTVPSGLSNGLPYWLKGSVSNRAIVFNMWMIAMIIIGFDEWHNLGILPRPARLWDTSLLYGLLAIAGFVDVAVPIANILAIGFTIALAVKYFQGGITPTGTTKTKAAPATPARPTGGNQPT
jgi:hypothetical protein